MSLAERLRRRIETEGPMTMADWMAACLLDPEDGYYTTREPFGARGDFTTAPEISQMFGELVGLALAQAWLDQGRPEGAILAELGPGRGTLMADALRAVRAIPGFPAQVHLVEASPRLRDRQLAAVPGACHHDSLADLPDAPLFLVANEFFDALPVRQFVRSGAAWRERMVRWADGFQVALAPELPSPALEHRLADTPDGTVVELAQGAETIAGEIGRRIAARGGAALLIDYGGWRGTGDTVQALRDHAPVDPLAHPGKSDLTAHVDFALLARAAHPARPSALTPQGVFLERLGITARAQTLAAGLGGAALESHVAAHRRLTHPAEMGDHFKVLGLGPPGAPPLPGLDPMETA